MRIAVVFPSVKYCPSNDAILCSKEVILIIPNHSCRNGRFFVVYFRRSSHFLPLPQHVLRFRSNLGFESKNKSRQPYQNHGTAAGCAFYFLLLGQTTDSSDQEFQQCHHILLIQCSIRCITVRIDILLCIKRNRTTPILLERNQIRQ